MVDRGKGKSVDLGLQGGIDDNTEIRRQCGAISSSGPSTPKNRRPNSRTLRCVGNKCPPGEPEVLRLQAPQTGLIAIGEGQNPRSQTEQRQTGARSGCLSTGRPSLVVALLKEAHSRICQTSAASPAEPGDLPTD